MNNPQPIKEGLIKSNVKNNKQKQRLAPPPPPFPKKSLP